MAHLHHIRSFTLGALLLASLGALKASAVRTFRCECPTAPLGLDVGRPRLSWVIESDQRGEQQTACQVLVAASPERLAQDQEDRWDSGKVASDQSIQIEYAGLPLTSRMGWLWMVRV